MGRDERSAAELGHGEPLATVKRWRQAVREFPKISVKRDSIASDRVLELAKRSEVRGRQPQGVLRQSLDTRSCRVYHDGGEFPEMRVDGKRGPLTHQEA